MANERVIEDLLVPLNEDEVRARGEELAKKVKELEEADDQRKAEAKASKEVCDGIQTEITRLGGVVRNKQERRPVDCTWEPDWERGTMLLRRDDTGVVVESRPMTDNEKQTRMKLHEGGRRQRADTEA